MAVTPVTSCGEGLSSAQTEDPDACCGVSRLKVLRGDSAITKHLKSSEECRRDVCVDVLKWFQILARGRNKVHPNILEALFIARHNPELCCQKEHVRRAEDVRSLKEKGLQHGRCRVITKLKLRR